MLEHTFYITYYFFPGIIYYVTESGKCTEVLNYGFHVEKLLYHEIDDGLIIVGEGLNFGYYSADMDGSVVEVAKVSFSYMIIYLC